MRSSRWLVMSGRARPLEIHRLLHYRVPHDGRIESDAGGRSRRILPVARLLEHNGGYEFAYINAVEEATRLGFNALMSFPELDAVYHATDLPLLFTDRLMPKSRPDFTGYITELGLTAEQAEPFAVLARSEGRRATDSLEIFSGPLPCDDGYEGFFLAPRR